MNEKEFPRSAAPHSVSIILLTHNGMPRWLDCLERLESQVYPGPREYIHIDTESSDGTLEAATARGIESRNILRDGFHHARTRNLAASFADHDLLVFLSQDALPKDEHWLAALLAPFADPEVAAVYGRQLPNAETSPLRAFAMDYNYPDAAETRTHAGKGPPSLRKVRFSNANAALRREVWRRHPFDDRAALCEDQGLCRDVLRAGYRVVYEPSAAVFHCHERNVIGELRWAFANGQALTQLGILGPGRARPEAGYGLRRVFAECGHFMKCGRPFLATQSITLNAARWLGVQLGKHHHRLPAWLRARLNS